MNQRTQQLLDRVPDHPAAAPVRKAIIDLLTTSDGFKTYAEEIAKDADRSPQGRRKGLVEALQKGFARDLRDACKPLDAIKSQIDQLQARIKSRPVHSPNPTDVAGLLSALLEGQDRKEIRQIIRDLPPAERSAMVFTSTDPRIVEAVLQMPSEMSGLPPDRYEALEKIYTEKNFAPELQKKAVLEELVAQVEGVHALARGEMQRTLGLDDHQFDQMMKPIELKLNAPWLKRDGDSVRVITPGGVTAAHDASADELRDGVYYENFEAYRQARAA
jgi:hypothetical protein